MYTDSRGRVWQKGGLHIHTTNSDGAKTPEQAEALYREAGYDFIALTDHWFYGEAHENGPMRVLSGLEYDVGSNTADGIFHIVGVGMERAPSVARADVRGDGMDSVAKAQRVIDSIRDAGGLAILAHPAWSLNRPEEILRLRGVDGVEMFNAFSGMPWQARANSDVLLDVAASQGWARPVHASDDSHLYAGEQCSSYIWVQAENNSRACLLDALRQGRVFASRGGFLEVERAGNTLHVRCTPSRTILFQTGCVWIPDRVYLGEGLTEAEYTIRPGDRFARVEIADDAGRQCWSGYYFYENK